MRMSTVKKLQTKFVVQCEAVKDEFLDSADTCTQYFSQGVLDDSFASSSSMFDPYFILRLSTRRVTNVLCFCRQGSAVQVRYSVAIGKADSRSKLTNSQLQPKHSGI